MIGYAYHVADMAAGPDVPVLPGIEDLVPIGRGGFAMVYRGWQPALHRSVAVKVLDAAGPEGLVRFEKELRALGALSGHPNVVAVYDAGEVDGRPYLVMPLLTGGSLAERLRSGALPPDDVIRLGVAVADAVSTAHRLGVLHRDIKPANILATAYGDPQLADFGIARFVDSTVTKTELTATVGYTAPEVLAGGAASPRSDVYSLGATLYTAACGVAPFAAREGESIIALGVRAMESTPAALAGMGVAAPLSAVIERAMAKDPEARFGSAAAVREALTGIDLSAEPDAGGEPTSGAPTPAGTLVDRVAPPGVAVHAASPRRRSHRVLIGAVVGTVALIAVAIGLLAGGGSTTAHHTATGSTGGSPATSTPSRTGGRSATTTAPAPPTTAPSSAGPKGTAPASLTQYVDTYYALVDQHDLSQSFTWLSPAFQQRIGYRYYQQFWNGIRQVAVLDATPSGAQSVAITLRYVETNGTAETESATLTFITDPSTGKPLIDTDQVT